MADEPVAIVWPPERAEAMQDEVRDHLHVAPSRTTVQDVRFAQQQVVELAVRAMSPGTNDPYTAINAIEQVTYGVLSAASRPTSGNTLLDDDLAQRLYVRPVTVSELVDTPFDHIRPYAKQTRIVLTALVDLAARIREVAHDPEIAARADRHVDALLAVADLDDRDREALVEHVALSRRRSVTAPPAQP